MTRISELKLKAFPNCRASAPLAASVSPPPLMLLIMSWTRHGSSLLAPRSLLLAYFSFQLSAFQFLPRSLLPAPCSPLSTPRLFQLSAFVIYI
jgi:hypothetical protein